jgi:hypothetical protein
MRVLWAFDNYPLYQSTLATLGRLSPGGETGSVKLGEPYYSCPLRIVYSPEGPCQNEAYVRILTEASAPEIWDFIVALDPKGLFHFLVSPTP